MTIFPEQIESDSLLCVTPSGNLVLLNVAASTWEMDNLCANNAKQLSLNL
jgi:hypothetical protein